jgi:dynactin complex subunit
MFVINSILAKIRITGTEKINEKKLFLNLSLPSTYETAKQAAELASHKSQNAFLFAKKNSSEIAPVTLARIGIVIKIIVEITGILKYFLNILYPNYLIKTLTYLYQQIVKNTNEKSQF